MDLKNYITEKLKTKPILFMTHLVIGSQDKSTQKKLINTMLNENVDIIELQIPFSDPSADGPTIMIENQKALDNNISLEYCFEFAEEVISNVNIPVLFMGYFNNIYKYSVEKFIKRSASIGISGFIIPDIPPDQDSFNYYSLLKQYDISPVMIFSANISKQRIQYLSDFLEGFFYYPLRLGVTGERESISEKSLKKLQDIIRMTKSYAAAGFGISKKEHVDSIKNIAHIAVIGSKIINIFNQYNDAEKGCKAVAEFLRSIQ